VNDSLLTFDPKGGSADAGIQKMMWQRIGMVMPLLADLDLDALVDSIELGDTFGPFLDPTAYMNANHDDRRRMARLARLLKPAVEHWREEIAPNMKESE
jgi:hypothetical protein